jgi:hypothetical protein
MAEHRVWPSNDLGVSQLGDEVTVQRLLAEGIPEKRAQAALARLRAFSGFGGEIDEVVEVATATAETVLKSGGSESDALRAAYFRIEILRGRLTWSAGALDAAKSAAATAMRG